MSAESREKQKQLSSDEIRDLVYGRKTATPLVSPIPLWRRALSALAKLFRRGNN